SEPLHKQALPAPMKTQAQNLTQLVVQLTEVNHREPVHQIPPRVSSITVRSPSIPIHRDSEPILRGGATLPRLTEKWISTSGAVGRGIYELVHPRAVCAAAPSPLCASTARTRQRRAPPTTP